MKQAGDVARPRLPPTRARAVASIGFGLAGALYGPVTFTLVDFGSSRRLDLLDAASVFAIVALAAFLLFARLEEVSTAGVVGRTFIAGAIAGGVSSLASMVCEVMLAPDPNHGPWPSVIVVGLVFIVGMLTSVAPSLAALPFVFRVRSVIRSNTIDVVDRLLFIAGVLGALAGGVAAFAQARQVPNHRASGFAVLAISAGLFLASGVRLRARARWLGDVIAGREPGFSVVERRPEDDALPAFHEGARDEAVIASTNMADGPFRSTVGRVARFDRAQPYGGLAWIAFACAVLSVLVFVGCVAVHEVEKRGLTSYRDSGP